MSTFWFKLICPVPKITLRWTVNLSTKLLSSLRLVIVSPRGALFFRWLAMFALLWNRVSRFKNEFFRASCSNTLFGGFLAYFFLEELRFLLKTNVPLSKKNRPTRMVPILLKHIFLQAALTSISTDNQKDPWTNKVRECYSRHKMYPLVNGWIM